jgi:hypothetical protein
LKFISALFSDASSFLSLIFLDEELDWFEIAIVSVFLLDEAELT